MDYKGIKIGLAAYKAKTIHVLLLWPLLIVFNLMKIAYKKGFLYKKKVFDW